MSDPWKENDSEQSITYPISEVLRRAKLKIKIHDRNIPMTSDVWGMFPSLIGRYRKINRWSGEGVIAVKVFYDPQYYTRNRHTPHLMDPLHLFWVLKYSAIKD